MIKTNALLLFLSNAKGEISLWSSPQSLVLPAATLVTSIIVQLSSQRVLTVTVIEGKKKKIIPACLINMFPCPHTPVSTVTLYFYHLVCAQNELRTAIARNRQAINRIDLTHLVFNHARIF